MGAGRRVMQSAVELENDRIRGVGLDARVFAAQVLAEDGRAAPLQAALAVGLSVDPEAVAERKVAIVDVGDAGNVDDAGRGPAVGAAGVRTVGGIGGSDEQCAGGECPSS